MRGAAAAAIRLSLRHRAIAPSSQAACHAVSRAARRARADERVALRPSSRTRPPRAGGYIRRRRSAATPFHAAASKLSRIKQASATPPSLRDRVWKQPPLPDSRAAAAAIRVLRCRAHARAGKRGPLPIVGNPAAARRAADSAGPTAGAALPPLCHDSQQAPSRQARHAASQNKPLSRPVYAVKVKLAANVASCAAAPPAAQTSKRRLRASYIQSRAPWIYTRTARPSADTPESERSVSSNMHHQEFPRTHSSEPSSEPWSAPMVPRARAGAARSERWYRARAFFFKFDRVSAPSC